MAQNSNVHAPLNGWRTDPMYSFREAANLAHVSAGTVRNWIRGYGQIQPLFDAPPNLVPMVSFLQLIEVVVAARFRKAARVSYGKVQTSYDDARRYFKLQYPFAHLRLEAVGGHIVGWLHGEDPASSALTLDQPAQWPMPGLVLDVIHQLEYDDVQQLAVRWYPVGVDVPIVIDPRLSAGVPTIKGRRVTVHTIHKRFKAQQKISFIAQDLDLDADLVELALQYAEKVAT